MTTQTISTKTRLRLLLLVGAVVVLALPASAIGRPQLAPASAPIGAVCNTGPSFTLSTAAGYIYTPDGNTVFMWGYRLNGGSFQMPGPVLCVTQGQTVNITLNNPTKPN